MFRLKIYLCCLFIFIFCDTFPQINKELVKKRNKQISTYEVPNGIWLYENIFIDESEICNVHWLEYMFYMERDSTDDFLKAQEPYTDALQFKEATYGIKMYKPIDSVKSILYKDEYMYHYLRYPGFRYFPVVGITYEQVLHYSKWRSKTVTRHINDWLIKKKSDERVYTYFRLPTKEEWEFAALGLLDKKQYPYGLQKTTAALSKESYAALYYLRQNKKDSLGSFKVYKKRILLKDSTAIVSKKTYKNLYMSLPKIAPNAPSLEEFLKLRAPIFNCDYTIPLKISNEDFLIKDPNFTHSAYSEPTNQLGISHMNGNVAEMTNIKGIAKGGSWRHAPEQCTVEAEQYYDCPEVWLGFRNVCEVYTYHKDSIPPKIKQLKKLNDSCAIVIRRDQYNKLEKLKKDPTYQREQIVLRMSNVVIPDNPYIRLDSVYYKKTYKETSEIFSYIYKCQPKKIDTSYTITKIESFLISWDNRPYWSQSFLPWVSEIEIMQTEDNDKLYYLFIVVEGLLNNEKNNQYFYKILD